MGKRKLSITEAAKIAGAIGVGATGANAFDGIEAVNPYVAANYTQVNYEKIGGYSLNTAAGGNKTIDLGEDHSIVLDANAAWQNFGTPSESAVSVGGGVGYVLKTKLGNERALVSVGASTPIKHNKGKAEYPTQISVDGRISFGK